jgi:hypothetical protein
MPEYQAVLTVWVTASSQEQAVSRIGVLMDQVLQYRLERIQVAHAVTGPGPMDEEFRYLARAYEALGVARPSWRVIPRDQADRLAGQLLADYTAAHGHPGSAAEMTDFTRAWVKERYR